MTRTVTTQDGKTYHIGEQYKALDGKQSFMYRADRAGKPFGPSRAAQEGGKVYGAVQAALAAR